MAPQPPGSLPRGKAPGTWWDRLPLVLLLIFLWALVAIMVLAILRQYSGGAFDLMSAGGLWDIYLALLVGALAIGTTLYVRVKFR